MATEGEVTLRVNLIGAASGAAVGGGVRPSGGASPAAGGDITAAIRSLEQAISRLAAKQPAKEKEGGGGGGGAVAGFVGGVTASVTSAMLDQLTSLMSVLVTSLLPDVVAFLGRVSLSDERAAAQQVGALTSQYAMLGGDPSQFRGTLIAQATRAARIRREEQVAVDAAAGLTGLESGVEELGTAAAGAMYLGQRRANRLAIEAARAAAEMIGGLGRQ